MSAARLIAELAPRGLTIAVAESLTGGLVVAELVSVPGASAVLRGGVVAYATDLKHSLLGVDRELLDRVGAVDGEVARQMAAGVRERLAPADLGLATTGVAGPDPQDGHAPGDVWLALATASGIVAEHLELTGDRDAIRRATVDAAFALVLRHIAE